MANPPLASGSQDNTIRLWSMKTGKEQAILKGHTEIVWCVAVSPDGKTLASGSEKATIKFWDVTTGKEQATLNGLHRAALPLRQVHRLLVHGLLGAPLYTALLLHAQSWAGAIGLIGTLGLVASGVHIVASSLEQPREWRQTI